MIVIREHIESIFNIDPISADKKWDFSQALASKDIAFFESLLSKHGVLDFEYNVLCLHLIKEYPVAEYWQDPDSNISTDQLISGLMLAEGLAYLYEHYLIVPREVLRFQDHMEWYRKHLQTRGYQFDPLIRYEKKTDEATFFLRGFIASLNPLRLIVLRAKRLLDAMVPLAKNLEQFVALMAYMNQYLNPIIAHISWMFFVPRLLINITLILKHLLLPEGKEADLRWQYRLLGQLQRRWFEIGNDVIWLTAGLLNCFVFTGTLTPIGIYFTVFAYLYDVIAAGIRAAIELHRLNKLQMSYSTIAAQKLDLTPEMMQEMANFQTNLQERIDYESMRLLLSVGSTSALLVAIILCFTPVAIVSAIGAGLLLTTTIVTFALFLYSDSCRPENNITKLPNPYGFFQPEKKEESSPPEEKWVPSPAYSVPCSA